MGTPQPLPAELEKRPFTVAEALAHGVPATSLRGPRLRSPFRGVRVPAELPDDVATDAAALALLLGGRWAFSHATAAALIGLPVPTRLERRRLLHVAVDDDTPVPQVAGVVGHEGLDPDRVHVRRDGLPVVHPARTWCDLVPLLGADEAVVLGDAVVRRWGGLALLDEVLAGRAGARGVVRMRRLRPLLRERVDSPQETRTRLLLLRAGLPEPECGLPVYDAGGGWLATPDLSWPAVKVAIEYDGDVHRKKRRQWLNDIGRNENMADHGWRVLVVTADDLQRPWVLVQRVSRALRERGLTW
jgi:hypothetical protein